MVDRLNVNHKVGWIQIKMSEGNKINEKTIKMMNQKYKNIYRISIYDINNRSIETSFYQELIEMVEQKRLLKLSIQLIDSTKFSLVGLRGETLSWIKKINEKVKQKKDMDWLLYKDFRINEKGETV